MTDPAADLRYVLLDDSHKELSCAVPEMRALAVKSAAANREEPTTVTEDDPVVPILEII
jgi:hypothetical protein